LHIAGYAIVCRNDCIADAAGVFPDVLKNDADWEYFQTELDTCALTVVGSASHRATPNVKKRRRLILSRSVTGLLEQTDGWWWNPELVSWATVVDRLGIAYAKIGIPGGQVAFDFFLTIGFTSFHLSRANRAFIDSGRKIFSGPEPAETTLRAHGLKSEPTRMIDPSADVTLTVYR
jgi:hypothetical protein